MRVGVGDGGGAVGGPAGVADAGLAGEGLVDEEVGEVDELAHGTAAVKLAGVDRGDAGAVIAPVFEPFQRLDQEGRCFMISKDPDNTTHFY
jgi:hypothetical protein